MLCGKAGRQAAKWEEYAKACTVVGVVSCHEVMSRQAAKVHSWERQRQAAACHAATTAGCGRVVRVSHVAMWYRHETFRPRSMRATSA